MKEILHAETHFGAAATSPLLSTSVYLAEVKAFICVAASALISIQGHHLPPASIPVNHPTRHLSARLEDTRRWVVTWDLVRECLLCSSSSIHTWINFEAPILICGNANLIMWVFLNQISYEEQLKECVSWPGLKTNTHAVVDPVMDIAWGWSSSSALRCPVTLFPNGGVKLCFLLCTWHSGGSRIVPHQGP